MRVKRVAGAKAELPGKPPPEIKVVTEHYEPKDARKTLEYPLSQKTHFRRLHNSAKYTVLHFDHIEEIEDNSDPNSREIDSGKHQRGSITLLSIKAIQVGQLEPKKSVVGHINDEPHHQKDQHSDHLHILEE